MITKTIYPQNNNRLLEQWNTKTGQEKGHTTQPPFNGRFVARCKNFFDDKLRLQVYRDAKAAKYYDLSNGNSQHEADIDDKKMSCIPNFFPGDIYKDSYLVPLLGGFSGPHLIAPIAKFDRSCRLANKDELRILLDKRNITDSVADFTLSNMEKMAQLGNWSDQEVPFFANILKYTLNSDIPEISHLGWHSDSTSLSMTAVISPCKQEDGEYSGGELSFAEKAQETFFFRFCSRFFSIKTYIPETVKTYLNPENGCFFFDNLWSEHKVNKISLVAGESCEHILFTLSANPNLEQLKSFLSRNSDKNLVTNDGL